MIKFFSVILLVFFSVLFCACRNESNQKLRENASDTIIQTSKYVLKGERHFLNDYTPKCENGDVNVVVEIPTGTLEKWEVDKKEGSIKLEFVEGKPRIVQYLAYPGNYGIIPGTLLPKNLGGDGDPLDVLVLGDASERGAVIQCKIIGILIMKDRGEQDDKLIAVKKDSPFYEINSITELDENFSGVLEIVKIWFANYKGPGKIQVDAYLEKPAADSILEISISEFVKNN